eukprot:366131-Chlamydomonas_euryale.AAC.43
MLQAKYVKVGDDVPYLEAEHVVSIVGIQQRSSRMFRPGQAQQSDERKMLEQVRGKGAGRAGCLGIGPQHPGVLAFWRVSRTSLHTC